MCPGWWCSVASTYRNEMCCASMTVNSYKAAHGSLLPQSLQHLLASHWPAWKVRATWSTYINMQIDNISVNTASQCNCQEIPTWCSSQELSSQFSQEAAFQGNAKAWSDFLTEIQTDMERTRQYTCRILSRCFRCNGKIQGRDAAITTLSAKLSLC